MVSLKFEIPRSSSQTNLEGKKEHQETKGAFSKGERGFSLERSEMTKLMAQGQEKNKQTVG